MMRAKLRSRSPLAFAFASMAAASAVLTSAPAFATKKTSAAAASDKPATTDTETPSAGATKPAGQAQDVERPKPMLDPNQEAPKTDSLGHVHFASPNGEGLGRVVVNAPPTDKVRVFLEGRYFGFAPITIYSVPKGDYILEADYPNGKQISKPVTVMENDETPIDVGSAQALHAASEPSNGGSGARMTPGRRKWMYGLLIGSGAALAVGITFGILDLTAESNYENTAPANTARLDSIRSSGQRDAAIADIGFAVSAAAAIGAAYCAIPLIFGSSGDKPSAAAGARTESQTAFMLVPVVGSGAAGGLFSMRF
jgi:PEGA domain-containing protein